MGQGVHSQLQSAPGSVRRPQQTELRTHGWPRLPATQLAPQTRGRRIRPRNRLIFLITITKRHGPFAQRPHPEWDLIVFWVACGFVVMLRCQGYRLIQGVTLSVSYRRSLTRNGHGTCTTKDWGKRCPYHAFAAEDVRQRMHAAQSQREGVGSTPGGCVWLQHTSALYATADGHARRAIVGRRRQRGGVDAALA